MKICDSTTQGCVVNAEARIYSARWRVLMLARSPGWDIKTPI
jgi:hypothetical protein